MEYAEFIETDFFSKQREKLLMKMSIQSFKNC